MGGDQPANGIQLSGAEAVAASQLDRFEPELARAVLSLDVHCAGSLQSKLVKKTRYGPGMPLILGIQEYPPLFQFAQQ